MRLFTIIILIILALLAIPFVKRGKEYLDEKFATAKVVEQTAVKAFKYSDKSKK